MPGPSTSRDATLRRVMAAARDGVSAGVAVVGPPGNGKEEVATLASGRLAAEGAVVVRIWGRGRVPTTPAIADLLPPPVPSATDPLAVLAQALQVLQATAARAARAAPAPVVLVAYDAHLLDDVSVAALLQALQRRLVFLVCTVGGPAPDHLVPLWKDGLVERVELGSGAAPVAYEPDASTGHCWALHLQGRLLEAERTARRARHRALAQGRPAAAGAFATFLSFHLVVRGLPEAAGQHATEAVDLLAGRDDEPVLVARACRVVALAIRGEVARAHRELAPLFADRQPPGPGRSGAVWARAWATVQAGSGGEAGSLLRTAADEAAGRGDDVWELSLRYDLARLGQPEHATVRLGVLATRLPGALVPALAAHARALAQADAAGLDSVARELARIGADLPAAEAAARAAVTHRRQSRLDAAAVSTARAQLWAARCQGAATPALAGMVGVLSAREIEIAQLAATGEPSRALAGQLGVSVRTVDNHLGRCYAKLGVTDRAELVGLVCPHRGNRP